MEFCSEYNKLFAGYKPATDNVFSWLKRVTNTSKASVNYYRQLATKVVSEGIAMPENILEDLQTAINLRMQAADIHFRKGRAGEGHDHVIGVLQQILSLFCPQSPILSVPSLASSRCPSPETQTVELHQQQQQHIDSTCIQPLPEPQRHCLSDFPGYPSHYQQQQQQFYPQPAFFQHGLGMEYAPYPMGESFQFCDYGHFYQQNPQQQPYEAFYQPGVHPTYQQQRPQFQDPAILYMA